MIIPITLLRDFLMSQNFNLIINGTSYDILASPDTPLLLILRNDLGFKGPKIACASENCGACNVLVDKEAVPSCKLEVGSVEGLEITTIEGLGTSQKLHPLQQSFIELQALQCGYCTPGMIVSAQGLLNRIRYPTDNQIRSNLENNLCRCGVYDRVRRAIKHRIGRSDPPFIFSMQSLDPDPEDEELADTIPSILHMTPELDSWIKIDSEGTVTLFTGKVEYGQGIRTAFAQILADEMDLSLDQVRVVMADTQVTPDEGLTVGSMSLETTGNAVRFIAAEARQFILSIAYEELEVPIEGLVVQDGVITDPETGRTTTYWELLGGKKFGTSYSGAISPKSAKDYQVVGEPVQRLDLAAKVAGEPVFVQDLELPSMLHGRILRPPNYGARLISMKADDVLAMPDIVKVVQDGSFIGVIAESEHGAIKALELLKETCQWEYGPTLPDQNEFISTIEEQPSQSFLVVDGTPTTDPIPPINSFDHEAVTISATYARPYQMHGSLGPSAAVAQLIDGRITIWAHSQGIFALKASIANVLGLDHDAVHVIYMEGPGCYGHTGADDAALDAALLAKALPGRPISTKWTLPDERKWEPYAPVMSIKMQGSLDKDGEIINWNHDVWSPPHLGRARPDNETSGLLASWYLSQPMSAQQLAPGMWMEGGAHRNAKPIYDFPHCRIVKHALEQSPLRVSSLRSLGAFSNIFAIESFMDELAVKAEVDPLDFRLRNLSDERAIAVLETAGERAGWRERNTHKDDHGLGLALAQYKNRACYAAVIVEVAVNRESGGIDLIRAVIAADAGQIVNPDGLSNQLEGGFVQAASMALYEEVKFDHLGITSDDWESYPILRFTNAPVIETVLIDRPGQPFLGAGEGTTGPTPAAIANAVFNAVGIRMRSIPFRSDRILDALKMKEFGAS
jgi:CO/xanthine dehydrogenase Mo-binding subunit/aerobic-type carbon monoxide dehydrogenase small subunit (CoxS/CutS family)